MLIIVGICARVVLAQPIDQITIQSVADVETIRDALIRSVWGTTPWATMQAQPPTSTVDYYTPAPEDALPASDSLRNLDRIEQIVITMAPPNTDGMAVEHTSTAYLFHPQIANGAVVIVHHGHGCRLDGLEDAYNLDATIRTLLAAQYAVVGMRMPLFQSPAACGFDAVSTSHDDMFTDPAQQLAPGSGSPLQFFLEPVARVLHYLETTYPSLAVFPHMVGLSGGGWTTTVYAALDPRIILSFPVAGSLPLDMPEHSGYHAEQQWPDFYAIAGYKDLYILGSYGPALESQGAFGAAPPWRRQTQILNQYDDCCFTPEPDAAQRYVCDVQTVLYTLALDTGPAGSFVFEYDAAASTHQISLDALAQVIVPTLQAGAEGPLAGSCPTDRRPGGTCTERYGGQNGFQLCFATSTECGFEAVKDPVQSCDDVCRAGGGHCLRVYGNDSSNPCVALSEPSCARTQRYDDICVCSL